MKFHWDTEDEDEYVLVGNDRFGYAVIRERLHRRSGRVPDKSYKALIYLPDVIGFVTVYYSSHSPEVLDDIKACAEWVWQDDQ